MIEYEMCPDCLGTKKIDKNCSCSTEDLSDFDCWDWSIEKPYNSDDRSEAEIYYNECEKYIDPIDLV